MQNDSGRLWWKVCEVVELVHHLQYLQSRLISYVRLLRLIFNSENLQRVTQLYFLL